MSCLHCGATSWQREVFSYSNICPTSLPGINTLGPRYINPTIKSQSALMLPVYTAPMFHVMHRKDRWNLRQDLWAASLLWQGWCFSWPSLHSAERSITAIESTAHYRVYQNKKWLRRIRFRALMPWEGDVVTAGVCMSRFLSSAATSRRMRPASISHCG